MKSVLFQIIAGFVNIYLPSRATQERRILKIFPATFSSAVFDLVVIRLDAPFALNVNVRAIQLAARGFDPQGIVLNYFPIWS